MYAVQGPFHYVLPYVFTINKAECIGMLRRTKDWLMIINAECTYKIELQGPFLCCYGDVGS